MINSQIKTRGLTLVELMTVLAVISIIAAISWDYYKGTHRRSYRSDAVIGLTKARAFLEKCYSNYRDYSRTPECDLPVSLQASPKNLYAIAVSSSTTDTYTLQATAQNAQVEDAADCGVIGITNTGDTSPAGAGSTTDKCWPK